MRIKITNHFANGKEYFRFNLLDGPDEAVEVKGFSVDLIETFTKIIEWRERIATDYLEETLEDDETDY
jgi:hypothetical protein